MAERSTISLHIDHTNCSEMAIGFCQNPYRKLCLLSKVSSGEDSIGCCDFSNLMDSHPQSLRIVQECRLLEGKLDCHGMTDNVGAMVSVKQVKKQILRADWETCLTAASQHQSSTLAARISTCVSWPKLWDMAFHRERGTAALHAVSDTYQAHNRPEYLSCL